MQILVLGRLATRVDDAFHEVSNVRQARLLAALVADQPRPVSIDRLVDRVWDEGDAPADPVASLRTYVRRLRTSASAPIATTAGGYRLDVDPAAIDAVRFAGLVADARHELDPYVAMGLLDEALGLWQGDPYGDLSALAWLEVETTRLTGLHLEASTQRLELLLGSGRHDDALAAVESVSLAHPYNERIVQLNALSLYRAGRPADALAALEHHQVLLRDELGVDASPELQALAVKILNHDPELARSAFSGRPLRGYRLGEQIGEGAYSIVYRATQPSVDRDVAIKVIRHELARDPEFIHFFELEAQLVARLQHPHILPLHDFWREADRAYLVMRWAQGGTLADRLRRGPLPLDEAAPIVSAVAQALDFAHRQGVVHRDVKPSNILLDEDGNAYLADFGIALIDLDNASVGLRSVGSPTYAAPEQFARRVVGPAADIYSLGVTLFEMVTGHRPWPDVTDTGRLAEHHRSQPLPATGLPVVDAIIARATDKDPDRRYDSALRLSDELGEASGEPAPRRTVEPAVNPYRGLRPFEEADGRFFFGRRAAVDAVEDHARRHPLTLLVAPSGAGKSSVLRAGLIPRLRGAGLVPVAMTPGSRPFEALVAAITSVATNPVVDVAAAIRSRPLAAVVDEATSGAEIVLVVDQLEELFALNEPPVAEEFLQCLADALVESSRVRVVASIRADFFHQPLASPSFGPLAGQATIAVATPTAAELAEAILQPALVAGGSVSEGLIAQLVDDVSSETPLPLLQYCLTEMWEQSTTKALDVGDYRAIGGIDGALARRADALLDQADDATRREIRSTLLRLVNVTDPATPTGRRELLGELYSAGVSPGTVDRLVSQRLLTLGRDPTSREPTVELSHEALIGAWPRFRQWVDETHDDLLLGQELRSDAQAWDRDGRDPSALYRETRLERARAYAQSDGAHLTSTTRTFLAAGQEAADSATTQTRRTSRRFRAVAVAAGVAALVAGVAGVGAWRINQQAQAEAAAANFVELSNTILAEADERTELALLLAAEAYAQNPGVESQRLLLATLRNVDGTSEVLDFAKFDQRTDAVGCYNVHAPGVLYVQPDPRSDGPDTVNAFHQIDLAARTVSTGESPIVCDVRQSPTDSALYAGADADDAAVVVDASGVRHRLEDYSRAFFAADGNVLARRAEELATPAPYDLLDVTDGTVIRQAVFEGRTAVLSPGHSLISVIIERDFPDLERAVLLDAATYEVVLDLDERGARATSAEFSADDSRFGYIDADETLLVWDTSSGELVLEVDVTTSTEPARVALSPDGSIVVVAYTAGLVRMMSLPEGTVISERQVLDEPLITAEWIDDSTVALLRSSGLVTTIGLRGGGIHDKGPAAPARPGAGWIVTGDPEWAFYGNLSDGRAVDRLVNLSTGEVVEREVTEWVLVEGGSMSILTDQGQQLFMQSSGDWVLVDLDGNVEARTRPLDVDRIPEIFRFALAGGRQGEEWAFLTATAGAIDAVEELRLQVIDVSTLEETRPPVTLTFPADDGVNWVNVFHEGVIYVESGTDDGALGRFFELDGTAIAQLDLPEVPGWVRMSYDRRYVLTGSRADDVVRLYDLEASTESVLPITSEPRPPEILPDGRFMLQTRAGEYELWQFDGPQRIGSLAEPGSFASTQPSISEGFGYVWLIVDGFWTRIPLEPGEWFRLACEFAGRPLTESEWTAHVPGDEEYRDVCRGETTQSTASAVPPSAVTALTGAS